MNTSTPNSPDGSVDCTVRGPLLLIAINRPAKRNGFTPKMFRELGQAYTRLDDDPALRVGVLHAVGDHFTAGLDLPTIAPLMQRGEKAVPPGLVDPLNLGMDGYRRRSKPMVVAVQGTPRSSAASWPPVAPPCAWPNVPAWVMRCCTC